MRIQIHLYTQSAPVTIEGARNAYTKGPLYCVMLPDGTVYKFPLEHVFRIKEQDEPMSQCVKEER